MVSFGIRAKKDIIGEIAVDNKNEIYCSISNSNGVEFGDKIYVAKKDEIVKTLQLENSFGASKIMKAESEMYIQGAIRPANVNPNGVPFVVLDSESDEQTGEFFVKGIVVASAAYKRDTYMMVAEAEKIGYEGFHECYMAKINHETKEIEILNDDVEANYARSMAITTDGLIYVVDTPTFSDKEKVSNLFVYNVEGDLVDKYSLDNWADKIVINNQNIAYISHRGKTEIYDDAGNSITIFDINQSNIIDKITVDEGPSDLYLYKNYLFVSAYTASAVDAIDMEKNVVIGRIEIDDLYKIDQIIVTNNE